MRGNRPPVYQTPAADPAWDLIRRHLGNQDKKGVCSDSPRGRLKRPLLLRAILTVVVHFLQLSGGTVTGASPSSDGYFSLGSGGNWVFPID